MIDAGSSFQFLEGFIELCVNVWRRLWLLKEEKIDHESGEDSLNRTTEPTTLKADSFPISFPQFLKWRASNLKLNR